MGKKIILFVVVSVIAIPGVYMLGISRGKTSSQVLNNQQLESLQKSINDQSLKLDNLQGEDAVKSNDGPSVNSSAGIQSIIQSSIDKVDRKSKEKCQQELSEYNACLAEYNSKVAEYNSCLAEEANPNSWRYGKTSLCFKPSKYCFKPACVY